MKKIINIKEYKVIDTPVEIDIDKVLPKEIYRLGDFGIIKYDFTGRIDESSDPHMKNRAEYIHVSGEIAQSEYLYFEVTPDGGVKMDEEYTIDDLISRIKEVIGYAKGGIKFNQDRVKKHEDLLEEAQRLKGVCLECEYPCKECVCPKTMKRHHTEPCYKCKKEEIKND